MTQERIIYRTTVDGVHCRSAAELLHLKVSALAGVEAASWGSDSVLTVFADRGLVSADDVVRAIVDAGFTPASAVEWSETTTREVVAPEPVAPEPVAAPEAVAALTHDAPVAGFAPALQPEPAADEVPLVAQVAVAAPPAGDLEALDASMSEVTAVGPARASLVQRVQVRVSDDYYPSRLTVIPGVPVEIEFSEGHGCLARVLFEQFGIDQDLTHGGGIVRLPGLAPGEYKFSCGMHMVFGRVVAEA